MSELPADNSQSRREVRRQAFANFLLVLLEQAAGSGGRLSVRGLSSDAFEVILRDVRTLVRRGNGFAGEPRDFILLVGCPPEWPFDRGAALQPFIMQPDDVALPNSDGRGICVDLDGVLPERLLGVLYDTLRVRQYRLDHCVDFTAAAYVRAHQTIFPADPRPLLPTREGPSEAFIPADDEPAPGRECEHPVIDVAAGRLTVAVPPFDPPVFLRLGGCRSEIVDAARMTYLRSAGPRLRSGAAHWFDGPGLLVRERCDAGGLAAELLAMARALRALEHEEVAASYLEVCGREADVTAGMEEE